MCKKDNIIMFTDEICIKPPVRIYPANRILYNHIDEIWPIDLADMIDYKFSKNKCYRYKFYIFDNFSIFLGALFLKNKNSQIKTDEFSDNLTTSKRSPGRKESNWGAEFYESIFQNFLKAKILQQYSTFTDKVSSIAEKVIRTVRNFLKKPVSEKRIANWISELPSVIKQYNNTLHSLVTITPIQASKKTN